MFLQSTLLLLAGRLATFLVERFEVAGKQLLNNVEVLGALEGLQVAQQVGHFDVVDLVAAEEHDLKQLRAMLLVARHIFGRLGCKGVLDLERELILDHVCLVHLEEERRQLDYVNQRILVIPCDAFNEQLRFLHELIDEGGFGLFEGSFYQLVKCRREVLGLDEVKELQHQLVLEAALTNEDVLRLCELRHK